MSIETQLERIADGLEKLATVFTVPEGVMLSTETESSPESTAAETESPAQELADLGLATKTFNILSANGITTVLQLTANSEAQLLAIAGLGKKAVMDLEVVLETRGLALAAAAGTQTTSRGKADAPPATPQNDSQEPPEVPEVPKDLPGLQAVVQGVLKQLGPRAVEVGQILANDYSVQKLSELSPDMYSRFLAKLDALLAPVDIMG